MSTAAQERLIKMLRRQKAEVGASSIRDGYLAAIEQLHGQIRRWLASAEKEQLASVRDGGGVALSEPDTGAYYAPMLFVDVPRHRIRFIPRGVHGEPGAQGRIDIDAGDRIALLVRDEQGAWHFATRTPPSRTAVTEKSFVDVINKLLER